VKPGTDLETNSERRNPNVRAPVHRQRRAQRSGAAIIETAFCINLLFVLIAGVFEHGRIIMVRQVMDNAAREGTRQAIVNTTTMTTAQIQSLVTQRLANSPLSSLAINVTQTDSTGADTTLPWTSTTFGSGIAVQINGNYQRLTPLSGLVFVPSPMRLRARAVAWCEAN
jgi:Flp pilus assembly protein TadG